MEGGRRLEGVVEPGGEISIFHYYCIYIVTVATIAVFLNEFHPSSGILQQAAFHLLMAHTDLQH